MRHPVVAGLLASALLAGCSAHTAVDQTSGGDTRYIAGGGPATFVAIGHRRDVATISGTGLDGKRIDLADYRGSVVVLNVWASWCAPCRAETPYLVKAAADTAHLGVVFVGVLIKDSAANGLAFDRNLAVTYPSIVDGAGDIPARFRDLPPSAIPSTLVIDRAGRVAVRFTRPVLYSELVAAIDKVTAESA